MKRPFCIIIVFFFLPILLVAQNKIDVALQTLVSDVDMKNASISATVIDVQSGTVVASYQAHKSLVPASSMKVITTSSALAILGKDYRFKTEILYDGNITNEGVLKGNIYIKGYGDPTLGADKPEGNTPLNSLMKAFVTAIKSKGIKKIEGKIIGDASYYEYATTAPTWQWEDIGNYYGAGAGGLNINANTYELTFQQNPKKGGQPTVINVKPYIPNLVLFNEVTSGERNSGDECYIYGAPYQYTRFLRGTIPLGTGTFTVKGSIPEPAFSAASILLEALEKQGVSTSKMATTILEIKREGTYKNLPKKNIYTHLSLPLLEIINITNEESINLYCEAMLKAVGMKQKNQGTREKGIEAIQEYWSAKGLDMKGFFMEDGSGLSPRNGITSHQFATLMKLIFADKTVQADFKNSLPIAGQTGTLERMFKNSPAKGKIWAKTGSMRRIRSYTGYAKSNSGKWLSFSIIVNNYACSSSIARKKLEQFMTSLVSY